MIVDPSTTAAVGAAIVKAFAELRSWQQHQLTQKTTMDEKELSAVRALQRAVIRTSSYVGSLEGGDQGSREQEKNLADLWSEAAISFHGVNGNISPLLHLKSLSWSMPARWIDEKVQAAGSTLSEMNELVTQLLSKHDKNA